MKTIGIVTLYKVRNLGACLQALATKKVLEELGIRAIYVKAYGLKIAWELFKGDMGSFRPWYFPFIIAKDLKFRQFFKNFEEITVNDISNILDGVVIGSDSIWVSRYGRFALSDIFWGNIDCENVRAYAPSVGGAFDLSEYDLSDIEYLKKIKTITVRDELTKSFVKQCIGYSPEIVLDPTLLIDWKNVSEQYKPKEKENYIVIYGPLPVDTLHEIKLFALNNSCKLINVGSFNRRIINNRIVDPYEFVGYLGYAKYVFTSMFHGVMLCLSLNKNFKYIPVMENRTEKLQSTFDILNVDKSAIYDNCLSNDKKFSWREGLDYTMINLKLSDERQKSRKLFAEWFM